MKHIRMRTGGRPYHHALRARGSATSRGRIDPAENENLNPVAPLLGDFEQLVLFSLLRLGDGAYGALIRRDIESRTGRDLAISSVYVTLDRLEIKGYVRSHIGEPTPQRGGRRRKHVEVLPEGRRAAAQAYRHFRAMTHGLDRCFETP